MANSKVTADVISLVRVPEQPRPESPPRPSMFDGMVFHAPETNPPSLEDLGTEEPVQATRFERAEPSEPVTELFTKTSTDKPSIVRPLEVNCEALLGFMSALALTVPTDAPGPVSGVRMTYQCGTDKLYLEVAGPSMWATTTLHTSDDGDDISAVAPLHRSISVLRYLRGEHLNVSIGFDHQQIHLGPLSVPYACTVDEFPQRASLYTVEARAMMPAFYLEEIITRLLPLLTHDLSKREAGLYLDFSEQCAVASDGSRLHVLRMPRMAVESRIARVLPPIVTVAPEFIRFLAAVVDREWTGVQINEQQLAASGEDYGVIAKCAMCDYSMRARVAAGWRYTGAWIVDKAALLAVVKEAVAVTRGQPIHLRIDATREQVNISGLAATGERVDKTIGAKRFEGAPPVVSIKVLGDELATAVEACRGGLIRLGFDSSMSLSTEPMTVRGEDNEFLAIVPART